jgi:hypothetical protein
MPFDQLTTEFLKHISTLSFPHIIEGIIAGKYVKDALKYAKDKLKQKQLSGQYLFTPNPEELEIIKSIENSETYQRTYGLLGIHPLFPLLRLGIFVNRLNEQGRKSKVIEVKKKVYKKYGESGIRVLSLASTGELEYILDELSMPKYDKIKVCTLFNYILMKWNDVTLFIKKEHTIEVIESMIKKLIKKDYPYFLIFSYGSASSDTYSVIARLDNENFFRNNKYLPQIRHKNKNEDYAWVIEHLEKDIFGFCSG